MNLIKYIPLLSAFVKTWLKNKEHDKKIKDFDKTAEKLSVIENLIVRLEKKHKEINIELDNLHKQIMINRIINIALSVIIIIGTYLIYFK
ncbi:MAG TPA: hypothetical protein PL063_08140 [Candidatus Cloacimonadota bacterium]|nr:hypothetical protein [Candidatus Cloacimonadota bacterium]HQB40462.1 hypothetical protein [Candidatus Cloacimonadota bacterium]